MNQEKPIITVQEYNDAITVLSEQIPNRNQEQTLSSLRAARMRRIQFLADH